MLVDEDIAKKRVHAVAGVGHRCFQVHACRSCLLAAAVQGLDPLLGVVQRLVDVGAASHGLAAPRHDGGGAQSAQRLQRGGPFFQVRVTGVDTGPVFHQVTTEQDFLLRDPGDGVTTGVAGPGMPDLHLHSAQVKRQPAWHLATRRVTTTHHQGRPGQARHTVRVAKQPREPLHLALHVLCTTLVDQIQRALAGDDLGRAFGRKGAGTKHTHRVVVRQQHVLDRLVTDSADTRDQVARHGRCGGGITHQDKFVADDDARVRVTLGGIGPAVGAELLESDFLVLQVGLGGKGFWRWGAGHGNTPLVLPV